MGDGSLVWSLANDIVAGVRAALLADGVGIGSSSTVLNGTSFQPECSVMGAVDTVATSI